MKALETVYRGHVFRSRLEARWAVFFDQIRVRWEYEPEGFKLDDGSNYLPDFFLHFDGGIYAEIKPEGDDFAKAREFAKHKKIVLLDGAPQLKIFKAIAPPDEDWEGGEYEVCFSDKYLPGGNNASENRFYTCPADEEEAREQGKFALDEKAEFARSLRFSDFQKEWDVEDLKRRMRETASREA
jgi:hypothetical protein